MLHSYENSNSLFSAEAAESCIKKNLCTFIIVHIHTIIVKNIIFCVFFLMMNHVLWSVRLLLMAIPIGKKISMN